MMMKLKWFEFFSSCTALSHFFWYFDRYSFGKLQLYPYWVKFSDFCWLLKFDS